MATLHPSRKSMSVEKPANGLLIYLAAAGGNKDELKEYLKDEKDINYVDNLTGMMPVHAAASWGNPECLEILIENGADINQRDEMLCTPVHHAARNGHQKAFEWLSNHGANLISRNLFGQTPADMALSNQFPELADQIRRSAIKQIKIHAQQTRTMVETNENVNE
ncbi:putative ank repeat-containing [Fasciola hepatica]|uniref:Ank repeat-containing n=1 Tax=Fasciola hepatica TaxID=6192 RepID=A0A4E0S3S5_FASHE|nr:putative ank repeat-containing [Fasciola hepatica]